MPALEATHVGCAVCVLLRSGIEPCAGERTDLAATRVITTLGFARLAEP